ncbi:MAG: HD domain-containing protein [Clostridiaceae bacterium]|nr:HD domain-containing protein [Clostridiaceae bacterium]
MDENQIIEKLSTMISPKRLKHSIGVRDTAEELAKLYNCDVGKARLAGLLHDCAKDIEKQQILQLCDNFGIVLDEISRVQIQLAHGPLGAKIAQQQFGIEDEEILDSIYYHTVGKANMSCLCKIIYLADYIEPNRDFPGVEKIREAAYKDLNESILVAIDTTVKYVLERRKLIHPNTIEARNYILLHERK